MTEMRWLDGVAGTNGHEVEQIQKLVKDREA